MHNRHIRVIINFQIKKYIRLRVKQTNSVFRLVRTNVFTRHGKFRSSNFNERQWPVKTCSQKKYNLRLQAVTLDCVKSDNKIAWFFFSFTSTRLRRKTISAKRVCAEKTFFVPHNKWKTMSYFTNVFVFPLNLKNRSGEFVRLNFDFRERYPVVRMWLCTSFKNEPNLFIVNSNNH